MEREEQFRRNLKHAFELFNVLLEDPNEIEQIPNNTAVVPMPSDDLELCTANEAMVRAARERSTSPHDQAHRALSDSTLLVNV